MYKRIWPVLIIAIVLSLMSLAAQTQLNLANSVQGILARVNGGSGRSAPLVLAGGGMGDGLNAIPAGTYLQSGIYNGSGRTWTITGIRCYTDTGSSTLNAAGNTLGALLTGAISCTSSWASGTQSGNVALTSGDYIKFTFVADGTTTQTSWQVSMTEN